MYRHEKFIVKCCRCQRMDIVLLVIAPLRVLCHKRGEQSENIESLRIEKG
jgi:hypothetical protein